MDNKIKITIYFALSIYLFVSCAFDGNLDFYEVKINDWAKVAYDLRDKNDTSTFRGIEIYPIQLQNNRKINKRYDWDDSDQKYKATQTSNKIVYNNDFIIYDDDCRSFGYCDFYKITPSLNDSDSYNELVKIERITEEQFDSIETNCVDCKVIDKSILKKIQYEAELEEKNSFPTKTVLFFGLIIVFLYFRYRRKKKKYKSNSF